MGDLISIIIPNRNGEKFISNCLNSIFNEKGDYEVIVLDDNSRDSSKIILAQYALKYPNLEIIYSKIHRGAASARNHAVQSAKGEILFFLDNDTVIKRGWYRNIIKFFKQFPDAGIAQTKILTIGKNTYDSAGNMISCIATLNDRARAAKDIGQFNSTDLIFAGKSASMLIRREVFEKLGGFDDDYQIFLEDTDICWRAWILGYKVYFCPSVLVWHAYGTNSKDNKFYQDNKVYYYGCRNTLMTIIKNIGWVRSLYIVPIQFIIWLLLAFMFFGNGKHKQTIDILKGIGWNIMHLRSILIKRAEIQQSRVVSDQYIFNNVGSSHHLSYYLQKALAYVQNKPY